MRIFKTELIRTQLDAAELDQLAEDFRRYKGTEVPADTFGRDAPYDHPHTLSSVRQAELRHLHLNGGTNPWPPLQAQYYRTSDDHLVYCEGFYSNRHFLLIALLSPDAHDQACDNSVMLRLAQMAERFRGKF